MELCYFDTRNLIQIFGTDLDYPDKDLIFEILLIIVLYVYNKIFLIW